MYNEVNSKINPRLESSGNETLRETRTTAAGLSGEKFGNFIYRSKKLQEVDIGKRWMKSRER